MLNMGGIQYLQFNQELFVQLSKIHVYILDKKKTKKGRIYICSSYIHLIYHDIYWTMNSSVNSYLTEVVSKSA